MNEPCAYCNRLGAPSGVLNDMCTGCAITYNEYRREKQRCKRGGVIVPSKELMAMQEYYVNNKKAGRRVPKDFMGVKV